MYVYHEFLQSFCGCFVTLSLVYIWRLFSYLKESGHLEKLYILSTTILKFIAEILKSRRSSVKTESDLDGPRGLPYFGSMFSLGSLPHETLASMVATYGDLFRLKAGCRRFVVISSVDRLDEIAERFPGQLCGKPRTFTTSQLSLGAHNDILQRWKKRRAHMNGGLKYLERYNAEDIITDEVEHIVEFFEECSRSGVCRDIRHDISFAVSRVIYRLSYGAEPDLEIQERLKRIVHALPDYTSTIGSFSPFDLLPRLRHVYHEQFSKFVNFNKDLSSFCQQQKERYRLIYKKHSEAAKADDENNNSGDKDICSCCKKAHNNVAGYVSGITTVLNQKVTKTSDSSSSNENVCSCSNSASSCICGQSSCSECSETVEEINWQLADEKDYIAPPADLFEHFRRRWERMSGNDRSKCSITEDNLYDSIEDIMRAGTETSSLVIQWFLLFVSAFPHVQRRMQQEMDAYMSTKRNKTMPEADDIANLPYCQAAITETLRYACLNPFLKRELTDDIQYDGYTFHRNTVLLYNQWAINNDERFFPQPREFLPERYLTPQGRYDDTLSKKFMPFGFGRRRCIGVFTGRTVCNLTALTTVYKFNLSLDQGPESADLTPISGIGLSPKPYKLKISTR